MDRSTQSVLVEEAFHDQQLIGDVRQLLAEELGTLPGEISDDEVRSYLAAELEGEVEAVCVHTLFEQQVERTPAAPAVSLPEDAAATGVAQHLSYRDLDRRANQLAHHLRDHGAGPEVLVGLCVEPSPEKIVAVLAILKTGGACLPLEPLDPPQIVAAQIENERPGLLVSTEGLLPEPSNGGPEQVLLSRDRGWIGEKPQEPPAVDVTPENLAWVIRCSGRAVILEHRSLHSRVLGWQQELAPAVSDVVSCRALAGTSAELLEWLWALLHGGCLVPLSRRGQGGIREEGLSVLALSPSELAARPAAGSGEMDTLRRILVSGSPQQRYVEGLQASASGPESAVCHLYDPPEAGTEVGLATGSLEDLRLPEWSGGLPEASAVYLFDRFHQPVPVGMTGEIFIASEALARGYLNDRRTTAERFVPDPFAELPGDRVFKAGELGRRVEDGTLDVLGSTDREAWVNGLRVDLNEVEAALGRCPLVEDAAVGVRKSATGAPEMVAYLVLAEPLGADRLQALVEELLPATGRPQSTLTVAALPRHGDGRVDRQALAKMTPVDRALKTSSEAAAAPRSEEERILLEIWQYILSTDDIGIHDNFFQIGGDSILAVQAVTRAKQAGLMLEPRQMAKHQTIAALAAVVGETAAVRVEKGLLTGPVPMSPSQHQLLDMDLPDPSFHNHAFLLALHRRLEGSIVERMAHHLLVHHDALRLRLRIGEEGRWEQIYAGWDATQPAFSEIDLGVVNESARQAVLQAAATQIQYALDLSRGPLMRFALFRQGSGDSDRLLIVVHHLLIDGTSWQIIMDDMHTLYQQIAAGEDPRLPPKTTSFRELIHHLGEHSRSAERQGELSYWLADELAEISPLPVDNPQGKNISALGRNLSFFLDPERTRVLCQEAPKILDVTIEELLLTALLRTFKSWTGNRSLLMEFITNGRRPPFDDVDLSRTVGWISASYPLRLEVGEDDDLERIRSIRDQYRAVPNAGAGYGPLRYLCSEEVSARLRGQPRPEVLFIYWGRLDPLQSEISTLFELAEDVRQTTHPRFPRPWLFLVSFAIIHEQLRFTIMYGGEQYRSATIRQLGNGFLEAMRSLLAAARSERAPETESAGEIQDRSPAAGPGTTS